MGSGGPEVPEYLPLQCRVSQNHVRSWIGATTRLGCGICLPRHNLAPAAAPLASVICSCQPPERKRTSDARSLTAVRVQFAVQADPNHGQECTPTRDE